MATIQVRVNKLRPSFHKMFLVKIRIDGVSISVKMTFRLVKTN